MAMLSTKLVFLAILCFLLIPNSRSVSRAVRVLIGSSSLTYGSINGSRPRPYGSYSGHGSPPADGSGSLGGVGGSRPKPDGSLSGHGSPSGTTAGGGRSSVTAGTENPNRVVCGRDKYGRYTPCTSREGGNP